MFSTYVGLEFYWKASLTTMISDPRSWLNDLTLLLNPYRTVGLSVLHWSFIAGLVLLLCTKVLEIERRLGWLSLFLFFVFILTPQELYGSWFANTRLLPFVVLVFLAALRVRRGIPSRALLTGVFAWTLLFAQMTMIVSLWTKWDSAEAEMRAGIMQAPAGTMFISLEQSGPLPQRYSLSQSLYRWFVKDDPDWQPPTDHLVDEVAELGEFFPIQNYLIPGKQPIEVKAKYLDVFLRINSSELDHIQQSNLHDLLSADHAGKQQIYRRLTFNSLQVNVRTARAVRSLLVFADDQYRSIRRASGIYADSGTFVVFIHRWSAASNPFPGLLELVSKGELYDVYRVMPQAQGSTDEVSVGSGVLGSRWAVRHERTM